MDFIFDLIQHILQVNGSLKFLYSVPSESLKIHPTLSRPPTIKIMVGGKQLGQIIFEIAFQFHKLFDQNYENLKIT